MTHEMAMTNDVQGLWLNQNGSRLRLAADEAGALSGVFESYKGRAARGKQYAVVGRCNGELLSFIVDFHNDDDNLHSMTNFSGRLHRTKEGQEELHTMWILSRAFEDAERTRPTQPWNSFLVNSDVFRREGNQ